MRSVKKQRGGLECMMNVLVTGEKSEDFIRDNLVVYQPFYVKENTARRFVQQYDVEPYKFETTLSIGAIHTHFTYELYKRVFYVLKGSITVDYVFGEMKIGLTISTDGKGWTLSTKDNEDDFGKYMVLKTFADNNDAKYVCAAVYSVLNDMVMRLGSSKEARDEAKELMEELVSMLEKQIDANMFKAYDSPKKQAQASPPPQKPSSSSRKTKTPSPQDVVSPNVNDLPDRIFIGDLMRPVPALQKCVRTYEMIERTRANRDLGFYFFRELDDIYKEDKSIQAFRQHITENKAIYEELASQTDRQLKENETWQLLLAKFAEYKKRLRRIALIACHPDKMPAGIFDGISKKADVRERAKALMRSITSTVNGQLDLESQEDQQETLFETLTVRDYIRPAPMKPKTTAAPSTSSRRARKSPTSKRGSCERDDRPCSPKAARDGRGPTKEELVQIAINDCDWGMTEAEIRRLTIPQLCARIKPLK